MSTLLLEELTDTLEQEFELSSRMVITAIRPILYIHNAPSGSIVLKIKNGATEVASSTQTIASIISTASLNAYSWGAFKFEFSDTVLNEDVTYTLEMSTTGGYSFAESAYIGWVRLYEDAINSVTGTITHDHQCPLSFELWGVWRRILWRAP